MFKVKYENKNAYITLEDTVDLAQTLDCGQAFRWEIDCNGIWNGIAFGKLLKLKQLTPNSFVLFDTDSFDFENIWREYFDLDRNYSDIIKAISKNDILKTASDYGRGIRVLNQQPWETLCSFIISQNNNIKRIKGIISRLCETFGEPVEGGYSFPSAKVLSGLTVEDLAPLRSGFRAKYIIDAAKKVSDGEVDLSLISSLSVDEARDILMKITGVGPKVADCTLLFSGKQISAFPKDVWIKRAMSVLFDGELPCEAVPYAGIVQQYIFFYARETKLSV